MIFFFFWNINLKVTQIPVDDFQAPTYHHCTRLSKHIFQLVENVYSILNIKCAASGLDSFRLMLSEIPWLRTPLFYFSQSLSDTPQTFWQLIIASRNLPSKQRPAPLSTVLSCFRDVPAQGKLPSLSVWTRDAPRWWPRFIETGKWATGEQLSKLGMTVFCDIVQVGLCQKVQYSR